MSRDGSAPLDAAPLHAGLALAAAVIGTAAMMAGSAVLAPRVPLRVTIAAGTALLAVPALAALLLAGRPLGRTLGLQGTDRRTAALAVLLGLPLWVASAGLLELQSAVWPPSPVYIDAFRRIHEALRPANALDALVSVLVIAGAPAVFEELLVRGVVLPSFRPVLGGAGAVMASALVFAVMHLDLYRFLFTLSVGMALGLARVRTGSLLPCMLAHATLNTLTFLAAPLVDDPSQLVPDPSPLLGAGLLVVGVPATIAVLRRLPRALTLIGGERTVNE